MRWIKIHRTDVRRTQDMQTPHTMLKASFVEHTGTSHAPMTPFLPSLQTFLTATLSFVSLIGSTSAAAVDRTVEITVTRHPDHLGITWTPKSALPGEHRLYPQYQVEVSANLVDWSPVGPIEPQRLGGISVPITRQIRPESAGHLFVRLVDRLEIRGNLFLQLMGENPLLDLRGADLRGANMDGTLLAGGMILDGANLTGATLRKAPVGYASLRGVDFTEADVSGANFYGTDLTGSNFTRTNAREATFGAATLTHLNLDHADLRDARSFEDTALGLRYHNTLMPDGTVRSDP